MSIIEAIAEINWTLDRSSKAFEVCREPLMELRTRLVNEELKLRERENSNGK